MRAAKSWLQIVKQPRTVKHWETVIKTERQFLLAQMIQPHMTTTDLHEIKGQLQALHNIERILVHTKVDDIEKEALKDKT